MAIQGLDKLKRKFSALPEAMQAEIRKAQEAGAEDMAGMARRLVPHDSGALEASIGWTYGDPPTGSIGGGGGSKAPPSQATGTGTDRISVYAGDAKAYYARWVEFGTVARPATPFFFPAYRALKKKNKSRNTRAMSKVAKRIAAGGN